MRTHLIEVCGCPGIKDFAETAWQTLNQANKWGITSVPEITTKDKDGGRKYAELHILDEDQNLVETWDLLTGRRIKQ